MGQLTRDAGDTMDPTRPATYTSNRGWEYRILASTETEGAWNIWVEINDEFRWMISPLHYDTYTAVPMHDPHLRLLLRVRGAAHVPPRPLTCPRDRVRRKPSRHGVARRRRRGRDHEPAPRRPRRLNRKRTRT